VSESAPSSLEMPVTTASDAAQPGSSITAKSRRGRNGRVPRLKRWDIILVRWLDAVSFEGGQSSSSDFKCPTRHSVGHFIKRTPESITIAMEDDRDLADASDCDSVTTIPLAMVKKVTLYVPKEN